MSQEMKFKNIFVNSKDEVKKILTSLWTGVGSAQFENNEYKEQITEAIENVFAPDNDAEKAEPLVQSMYKWEGLPQDQQQPAVDLVSPVWNKPFAPFKHQYSSWKSLLTDKKSIVVTTGTGSGKTECFMMPLIKDLADNFQEGKVEALFLYPLNALMEDQKDRLSKYIANSGQNLKFAVYNGNTLEMEELSKDVSRMPHEYIYRSEIRDSRPNILLTNPTMLEYILLRPTDQPILQNSQGALKWIVIDETHTFNGAGAAELALLIRRILIAFGVTADKVRFATSSATIGDDDVNFTKLKKFISDISGKNPQDIEVITGNRVMTDNQKINYATFSKQAILSSDRVAQIQNSLLQKDYIKLTDLIPEKSTIADKLEILDALCEGGMPAKAHYFFKVLDNGLSVKLDEITSRNTFKLHTTEELQKDEENNSPLLEFCRCQKCGKYVAIAQVKKSEGDKYTISRRETEDESIFLTDDEGSNFDDTENTIGTEKKIVIGIKPEISNPEAEYFYGKVNANVVSIAEPEDESTTLVIDKDGKCPYCKHSDTNTHKVEDDDKLIGFQSFRVSSEFISRIIAPVLLNEMNGNDNDNPYKGKQYISFVDSRQGASRGTLKQNIEVERRWVQSRVFHWLNQFEIDRLNHIDEITTDLTNVEAKLIIDPNNERNIRKRNELKAELEQYEKGYKTWSQLLDFLLAQPDFKILCEQFVSKNEISDGRIDEKAKRNYAQIVLFEEFNRRPKSALIAETLGFVQTYYPKLDTITALPAAINAFNEGLTVENKIELKDWKDLLKIFLDLTVRSNGSLYFKREDWQDIDIHSSQRFQTKKNPRRPVIKPKYNDGSTQNRIVYLLSALKGWDDSKKRKDNKDSINNVLDALWDQLTSIGLLQIGQILNNGNWVTESENPFRLNTTDISLKLCTKTNICPITNRPIDVTFKGNSPYIEKANAHKITETVDWEPFPYVKGMNNAAKITEQEIVEWATASRAILVEKGLWTSISSLICSYPYTFIQAEHTAQVDKDLAAQHQRDFKNHKINILACSTTMEMGVDLGDLELVVMNSIPPLPANYKQRAGRSGRNDMAKSAALTFCSSDPIGMRTMRNPMDALILRRTAIPVVDLKSPQVVQRHLNAFLFKCFVGRLPIFSERIIEFFTSYNFLKPARGGEDKSTVQTNGLQIFANAGIGEKDGTKYNELIDYLYNLPAEIQPLIKSVVIDTCFSEKTIPQLLNNTIEDIQRLYDELTYSFNSIQSEWNDQLSDKQKKRLNFKFSGLLNQNLLMYLSTHQFTPNANMPVNIIDFDLLEEPFNWGKSNNPSYELQQALSQYVPGNSVVLNNVCYTVRGVKFSNQFSQVNAFRQIKQCNTCGKTWIDTGKKCNCAPESIKIWNNVNEKNYLELIEPVGYMRDINENTSRLSTQNTYTKVNAHLLGTDNWTNRNSNRLFDIRSASEDSTSQILYYNIGNGKGFCVCTLCGKTAIEYDIATELTQNTPSDFYNNTTITHDGEERPYHYCITQEYKASLGQNFHYRVGDSIKRNIILGGLIQTDYCEIKIRYNNRDIVSDSNILHTLGLTIANVLAKYIGIERKDISFIALADSICLFDTAKGGAGYSKRLNDIQTMFTVFDLCKLELEECRFKEDILDKSTRQYANKIDIKSTLKWLNDEKEIRDIVPQEILATYSDARVAQFQEIVERTNGNPITLFVNNQIEQWNYDLWKLRIAKVRRANIDGLQVNLIIYGVLENIPLPIRDLLTKMKEWVTIFTIESDNSLLSPIAIVNNQFYFTNDSTQLNCDDKWASDNLCCTNTIPDFDKIELEIPKNVNNADVVKFTLQSNTAIQSKCLFDALRNHNDVTRSIFDRFKALCNKHDIKIRYQDEHLKSKLGIIITLQLIKSLQDFLECNIQELIIENEDYEDFKGREDNLYVNLPNSEIRDELISSLWDEVGIEYNEKGQMPHWRVLQIECNGHKLEIYPNGGFANGWVFNSSERVYYAFEDTNLDTNINLKNREELMFDIELK